jgi:DNA-binding NtrC family response regulator
VRIAPLRDRKDDIPSLITFFLERYGNGHKLTPEALDAMLSYDWPGNVRELENCVQHMVAVNSGPLLHIQDLPSSVQNHVLMHRASSMTAAATASARTTSSVTAIPFKPALTVAESGLHPVMPLAEVERRAILEALEYTRGDRAVAAHLLGIGRTTLYRKLKDYELAC